jgi:hypothetical protein
MKPLILKRNDFWREGRPDFSVFDQGKVVGRIY